MKSKIVIALLILTIMLILPNVTAADTGSGIDDDDNLTTITVSTTEDLANALDNNDFNKIILKNGTYKVNGISITRDLTVESETDDIITLDGENIQHLFYVANGYTLTLNNIKIFNGYGYLSSDNYGGGIIVDGTLVANNCIFDSNYVGSRGGGVLVDGGSANFTNCVFNDNHASHGGAIATYFYYGYIPVVHIKNCTFTKNYATYGGAIHVMGGYLYVEDSTFEGNTAQNYGSAIHVNKGFDPSGIQNIAYASIKNTTFTKNDVRIQGEYGGTVSVFGKVNDDTVTVDVTDSYFEANTAEYGGALCVMIDGFMNVSNTVFINNNATSYGGAVYVFDSAEINNCTFKSNNGRQGGAIAVYIESLINNSIFTDNTASLSGGAIRSTGDVIVNNSQFTSNTAPYGGAISAEGKQGWFTENKLIVDNCIIKENHAIGIENSSGGIGGGIYIEGGCDVKNSIIESNTAYYDGGGISINNFNNSVNINNNIIVNNKANQEGTEVEIENESNVNINNNWWGKNNPFPLSQNLVKLYDNETDTYAPYTPEEWIILNLNINNNNLVSNETAKLTATITNNDGKESQIPEREIIFSATEGTLNPTTTNIQTTTTTNYTSPVTGGSYEIKAKLDNEEQTIQVNVEEIETLIKINITETSIEINKDETITIHVTSENRTINGGTIILYNNGISVGTNTVENGAAIIQNQLEPGTYTINAYYIGEGIYENTNKTITLTIKNTTSPIEPINNTNNTNITPNTNKTIIITNTTQTGEYGEEITYTGKLIDKNGEIVIGHPVQLNITRLSSGANKVYTVITDYTGTYTIPINLAPGAYTIKASYSGVNGVDAAEDQIVSLIIYNKGENQSNKNVSILKLDKYSDADKKVTGQLVNNLNKPIIGYYVAVKLTRLSSGANKVYITTTDYTGQFTLPINLAKGKYLVECSFDGAETYTPSSNSQTLEVL